MLLTISKLKKYNIFLIFTTNIFFVKAYIIIYMYATKVVDRRVFNIKNIY